MTTPRCHRRRVGSGCCVRCELRTAPRKVCLCCRGRVFARGSTVERWRHQTPYHDCPPLCRSRGTRRAPTPPKTRPATPGVAPTRPRLKTTAACGLRDRPPTSCPAGRRCRGCPWTSFKRVWRRPCDARECASVCEAPVAALRLCACEQALVRPAPAPPPTSSRHVWCVATSVFDGVYVVRGDGVLPSQAADV